MGIACTKIKNFLASCRTVLLCWWRLQNSSMDITRNNFTERIDEIAEAINQSTFLAIDTEFTGLEKNKSYKRGPFDSPEYRYFKVREGSAEFVIIQFGLCCFKYKEETQSYEARPFNFYVFHTAHNQQAPDRVFQCQSSCIAFLVAQGFDFNRLFQEGIPYLTPKQEGDMRDRLELKHRMRNLKTPTFSSPDSEAGCGKAPEIPPEEQDFISETCDKISKFLESSDASPVLQLDPCNGYQRKLIYQTVQSRFSSVHLETKTNPKNERFIEVLKIRDYEDLVKKEKEKMNAETMELDEAVGFTKVMKLIAQSGKLVVGHNMLMDVMLSLNQFISPLPDMLDDFKAMVRSSFPRLLDTKHMASMHPFRQLIPNTGLGFLQQALEKDPFCPAQVELPAEFSQYGNGSNKHHEAGYDAYVTGCAFATMTNYLGKNSSSPKTIVEPSRSVVAPFLNKIFLMSMNDIPYLNLAGEDLKPDRSHVFHLSFPKEWKTSDIHNIFGAFGNIQIFWLNDTSAFVSLYKKDNANAVMKALGETRTMYRLVPFDVYEQTMASLPSNVPHAPASPSHQRPSTPRTSKKRSVPKDEDVEEEAVQPVDKKLCSEEISGSTVDGTEEEEEIPEFVPRSQVDSKTSEKEAAEADSTEMFAVPDW